MRSSRDVGKANTSSASATGTVLEAVGAAVAFVGWRLAAEVMRVSVEEKRRAGWLGGRLGHFCTEYKSRGLK